MMKRAVMAVEKPQNMMNIIRGTSAGIVTLAILLAGCGGKPPRADYEKAGGFSYDPPKGWLISKSPGSKYRISEGPEDQGFAPNINIIDEKFIGTDADYIDLNIVNLKKAFSDFTLVKREDFQTEDGLPATRVVFKDKQQGRVLRQTFCFFSNATRKYIVTCTAPAVGGEGLDEAFAASMSTFRVH